MNNLSTESTHDSTEFVPKLSLNEFIECLNAIDHAIPLTALKELLGRLDSDESDLAPHLHFAQQKYQRNLVFRNEKFEVLLLCFESGQRTPIHDHAGCACGVKVIQGKGVETGFENSDGGWLFATGSWPLPTEGVVGSEDMDIHQLSNLQPTGQRLVTLHVYSPPLGEVGNYSITDNSVVQVKATERNQ